MDISNIPQNLIKALETKNTEQLVALSRVLDLVLGKTVIANITSVAPVTEPERQELLKQTLAALAQLSQQANKQITPAIKAEIARLMQQQTLIQSPDLKWLNLVINNKALLTYSDRPLVAGQNIPVQLQSPQKLVLLDLLDADVTSPAKIQLPANVAGAQTALPTTSHSSPANSSPVVEAKNTPVINELLKSAIAELANKLASGKLEPAKNLLAQINATVPPKSLATETSQGNNLSEKSTLGSTPSNAEGTNKFVQQQKLNLYSLNDLSLNKSNPARLQQSSPQAEALKNILSEHLRNLISYKDAPNTLLSAINQLQQLPATSRIHLFTPSLEQALKSLAEKIRSPEQLAQPKILAQNIKDSGVFFENKLGDQKKDNSGGTNTKLGNIYSQDLKGSLLTLLNRVTQELNNKPVSAEQTLKLLQPLHGGHLNLNSQPGMPGKSEIPQTLALFVQELMHKPIKELSNKELRAQLLVLLQQHSVQSLAKIQLQQLHSINHELESKDSAAPTASWQIEVPVKHHHEVHHLHLRIDREWVDEKHPSETEKSAQKVKQWSVTLRFDLPTLGEFCAQLAIINTQVSATLWAAREKTFAEVRDHIDGLQKQLESEGISVKYLQCMRGMPPEKPMALSYSLIDIST